MHDLDWDFPVLVIAEPENEDLKEPCVRIDYKVQWATTVRTGSDGPQIHRTHSIPFPDWKIPAMVDFRNTPKHLSTTHKLWLTKVMLQMLWRWRRVQDPPLFSVSTRLIWSARD